MDEMTQQNAALVEEASAASEAILNQATHLAELVASYAVASEPPVAVARQVPAGPAPAADRPKRSEPTTRPTLLRTRTAPTPRPAAATSTPKVVSGGGGDEWDEF
jgi:hypothetical protein